jgi:ankyrin repeat protein
MLTLQFDEQGRAIPKNRPLYEKDDMLAAAYRHDTATVLAALEQGIDVNMADEKTGLTALHLAVGTNNLGLAKTLVEDHHAEFFADRWGRWPSSMATDLSHVTEEMMDYIVSAEAQFLNIE